MKKFVILLASFLTMTSLGFSQGGLMKQDSTTTKSNFANTDIQSDPNDFRIETGGQAGQVRMKTATGWEWVSLKDAPPINSLVISDRAAGDSLIWEDEGADLTDYIKDSGTIRTYTYPKSTHYPTYMVLSNKDTVVVFIKRDLDVLNLYKIKCDEAMETSKELKRYSGLLSELVSKTEAKNELLDKQLKVQAERITSASRLITELQEYSKYDAKKVKWLTVQRTGFAAIAAGLLTYILISSIK